MSVSTPDIEMVQAAFAEGNRERAFWEEHTEEFREEYPDKFVAIDEGVVVASDETLEGLVDRLRDQGREITHTWVQFVHSEPRYLIL